MKDMDTILSNNDYNEMQFYLEYLDVLIEFFEKRKLSVKELNKEKRILHEKIKDLSQ